MAKYAKWIGAILGWFLTKRPWGAILGFLIGSMIDESRVTVKSGRSAHTGSDPNLNVNDFSASLLILSAAVMKSDGIPKKSELDFIRSFFTRQYGEQKAAQDMLQLREMLKRNISVYQVCIQIKQFMPLASRHQLIHYLYGLSNADGVIHSAEINIIDQIGSYLGISNAEMNSLKAMYFRDAQSDYKILEIDEKVTDDEVKKAYRQMALKFHPDKVAQEGEEVQRAATEKFKKVQEAYENIKKKRGMN
jgi:DnaJ like chaperone protein